MKSPNTGSPAEDLCRNLRTFRRRLEDSTDELEPDLVQELKQELAFTMYAVSEKAKGLQQVGQETNADNPADEWLARLIDERLSIRLGENVKEGGKAQDTKP